MALFPLNSAKSTTKLGEKQEGSTISPSRSFFKITTVKILFLKEQEYSN